MDLCNLYDFYTFVFTLAFTPCTFNVLFYVRIKYYNNNTPVSPQPEGQVITHLLAPNQKGRL